MNWSDIINQFMETNQFASGGLMLMAISAVLGGLYKIVPITVRFLKRKFIVTIDIQSNDEVFRWLSIWLSHHSYSKKTRLISASTTGSSRRRRLSSAPEPSSDGRKLEDRPEVFFNPGPGNHLIWYKGRPVWFNRDREKKLGEDSGMLSIYEQYTLTMMGRDKDLAKQMIIDARDFVYDLEKDDTFIYTATKYGDWQKIHKQRFRDLSSVILKDDLQYTIREDIEEFLSQREWYIKRGIPYRRGYLLEGPPGTGKTSLVKAISGALDMDIYIINTSNGIGNDEFSRAVTQIPESSIILLEDIDAAFEKRDSTDDMQKLTFKTLLNTIDGVISPEGTILFMTTNHPEKLDPALIRKGRIDQRYHIGYADRTQAASLFRLFYPESNGLAEQFANTIPDKKTPADLQGLFLQNKDNPKASLKSAALLTLNQ